MMTEPRNSHPYHMHDAILAQPEAFVQVVERNEDAINMFATRISSCERVFLAGIGTSHHASLAGEHLVRAYGGGGRRPSGPLLRPRALRAEVAPGGLPHRREP